MFDQRASAAVTTVCCELPGALIDRDTGVRDWLHGWLRQHGRRVGDDGLAEFDAAERALRRQRPSAAFSTVLPHVHDALATRWGIDSDQSAALDLLDSVRAWPAYPDAFAGLRELQRRYRLVAVSAAVDRWGLEQMSRTLGDPFDRVLPSEWPGTAPPLEEYWRALLEALQTPPRQVLYCAGEGNAVLASAARAHLVTCRIERPGRREPADSTREAEPDLRLRRFDELPRMLRSPAA